MCPLTGHTAKHMRGCAPAQLPPWRRNCILHEASSALGAGRAVRPWTLAATCRASNNVNGSAWRWQLQPSRLTAPLLRPWSHASTDRGIGAPQPASLREGSDPGPNDGVAGGSGREGRELAEVSGVPVRDEKAGVQWLRDVKLEAFECLPLESHCTRGQRSQNGSTNRRAEDCATPGNAL